MLEAAARLLSEEGPAALTLRRVSADAGGSTQLVYTLFGGKPGLATALYVEGFSRLATTMDAALAAAPAVGDPERLVVVGRAYCDFAVAESSFFALMFAGDVAGHSPDAATRARCRSITLGRVIATVEECVAAGTIVADDATALAQCCWASAHGLAALVVAQLIPDDASLIDQGLRAVVTAHRSQVPR